jgi:two-component system response regulator ResD
MWRQDTRERGLVLVVDDEPTISEVVSRYLQRAGYSTRVAGDGTRAIALASQERPDLVLLDLKLPGINGLEVMRRLQTGGNGHRLPVIVLSAKAELGDRVIGLRLGADDYVVKPFAPAELVARVDAVLRRIDSRPELEEPIVFDGLELDPVARRVTVRDEEVQLTVREYDLLLHFMRHPGQVFSLDQLMDLVWQFSFYSDASTVRVHMHRLRMKVEQDPSNPRWLQTVRGVGYRFQPSSGSDRSSGGRLAG